MDSSGDVLSTSDRTDLGTFYPPVLTDVRKMKAQVKWAGYVGTLVFVEML